MAYRYQVVSVGIWRGKIKRWNTTFHLANPGYASAIRTKMNHICYPNPGDAIGDCSGGIASIAVYASTGGAPITNDVYFDWETPSTWIPFDGDAWSSLDPKPPIDASGESALLVIGNMAALSASGKPVTTRKYIHAVPSRTATDYNDPDVPASALTALQSVFTTGDMRNPAGTAPTSVTIDPWYGNHQRVRGRRRTTSQVVAQSFSAGVVAGSAAGGGASSAPEFQ